MTLTGKQIYDLNNMNMAAQNASIGSLLAGLGGLAGVHTVTNAEDSGSAVVLFSASGSTIQSYSVSILRNDLPVAGAITKTVSGSALTISGSSLATGDVVNYFIV